MIVKCNKGFDEYYFGDSIDNLKLLFGEPNRIIKNEEEKKDVWQYNNLYSRISFYQDGDNAMRFGYLETSNPMAQLFEKLIIGKKIIEVKNNLEIIGISGWEIERYDSFENHFNESNWLSLGVDYDRVTYIEIGVQIKGDEFLWVK